MPSLLDLLQSEALSLTLATLALAMLGEMRWPRRTIAGAPAARWGVNALLAGFGMALTTVALPLSSVAAALLAERAGAGLFRIVRLEGWLAGVLGVVLLDLVKYLQHLLMHRVGWLWRIHRAHHADPACDVSTSLRFHPFEALFAHALELATILALGIPPLAVALYRLVRMVVSTIVHANFALPAWFEQPLRRLVVTPDLHLIHHSALAHEQHCNLSGGLTLWDRLFGTYLAVPALPHRDMPLGIAGMPVGRAHNLRVLLNVFEGEET